jgi:hypothetical protein
VPVRSSETLELRERLYLQAEVDVVRIVVTNGNGFGVGCRISDYHVLANDAVPSWALATTEQAVFATPIEQLA